MKELLEQIIADGGKCPDDVLCWSCPLVDFECGGPYTDRIAEAKKRLKEMVSEKASVNLQARK